MRSTLLPPYKSALAALLLGLFLGPLGLMYSTVMGSIIMLVLVVIAIALNSHLGGFFVYLFWAICLYWNVAAVNRYNKRLFAPLHGENKASPKDDVEN
ncbi:MAG: hypothetical protein COV52_00955 [Gammaproteobacteria bacterium CG11_big_fil_rev_8_21_14_0_20_46_22]|nr:MAG: hypothetical protein COW05_03055 [Gammaproteobacteria bacterium CG12_big_fil_rev_8_21_14_0_65_46_12]PIR11986.1 MAG: hypothetical protein COV52_00955 [Gammaproteobacteria bacterium CG11_big_fil_rev_8_21_14_0_20_46_22]